MKLQIFTVRKTDTLSENVFYIVDMDDIHAIGGDFQPVFNFTIADLDRNGYYELLYSFQTGSGVSKGNFGCYTEGRFLPLDSVLTPPDLSSVYTYVIKKSGESYTIEIHNGKKIIKPGKLFIKTKSNGKKEVTVQ